MYLVLDSIIEMNFDSGYTIDNTIQRPFYSLHFYTKDELKTNYDQNTNFKCQMVGQSVTLELNVDKINSDFIKFTHKDRDMEQLKSLKGGEYKLVISDDKETVEYQLINIC